MTTARSRELETEDDTVALGAAVAAALQGGDVLALRGPLGAGKTTLARAIARGLGVPPAVPVRSPSYGIVHELPARVPLLHADLYRLQGEDEADDLDAWDRIGRDGVAVIEWADRFPCLLPSWTVWVDLALLRSGRRVTLLEPEGACVVPWDGWSPVPIPDWAPPRWR